MHICYHVLWRGHDLTDGRLFQLPLGIDQQLGHGRVVLLRRAVRRGHRERGRRRAGQLLRPALLRVSVQRAGVIVPLCAELARVRPLTGVRVRVLVQRGQPSEGLGADVAVILGLAGVHRDVPRQGVGPGERPAAVLADVRFLTAVSSQMQLQIRALGEGTLAHVAHVRLDAGVRAHMRHQRATLSETFAAFLAEKPFLRVLYPFMPLHVVCQRLSLRERLWTERALVRPVVSVLLSILGILVDFALVILLVIVLVVGVAEYFLFVFRLLVILQLVDPRKSFPARRAVELQAAMRRDVPLQIPLRSEKLATLSTL